MSDSTNRPSDHVLHIVAPATTPKEQTDKINGWLDDAGVDVVTCADVYRGLAYACRSSAPTPRAIIVDMSVVGSAEMAFFPIIARVRRNLPVLVYGSPDYCSRALDCGAKGLASADAIHALKPPSTQLRTPTEGVPASSSESPAPTQAKSPSATEASELGEPAPGKTNDRDDHHETPETDAVETRVPWQRYEGAPVRRAPSRSSSTSHAPADRDEPSAARRGSSEPLLTEEELRALIGDTSDPGSAESSS